MLLIYKAQASMCLSGLKSWLLKSRIYTTLNRSAAFTCYFRKWAVEEFPIFYFSHQRKAAIIVQQPSPGGENPPCCAEPSSPPRQTRVAAVTEGTSGSTATVRWIGVCFWAVWSDVPEVGIWFFFLFVCLRSTGWAALNIIIRCTGSACHGPGMCPDLLPCTWRGQQQSHPSSSLSLSPQGETWHSCVSIWTLRCKLAG